MPIPRIRLQQLADLAVQILPMDVPIAAIALSRDVDKTLLIRRPDNVAIQRLAVTDHARLTADQVKQKQLVKLRAANVPAQQCGFVRARLR